MRQPLCTPACVCVRECESVRACACESPYTGVWDKGVSLEQRRLTVLDLYALWSPFPFTVSTRMPPCVHWPGWQFWALSIICPPWLTLKKVSKKENMRQALQQMMGGKGGVFILKDNSFKVSKFTSLVVSNNISGNGNIPSQMLDPSLKHLTNKSTFQMQKEKRKHDGVTHFFPLEPVNRRLC